uniref:Uncharacterized protein n=1 Tax=Medicago truncatula TaxID=3880 RepID=Q1RU82_MEDTR|nr:hypothetical protein MtrDRAFT_AC153123g11v2 [Medicago truncatula]
MTAFKPLINIKWKRVRVAEHASSRRERLQRMEEDGVVPRHLGVKGRRADVEPQLEHEQENDEMDVHH